ncbi:hypothetical protein ACFL3M_01415, partial [Patescibacteria group bacterium]
MISRSQLRKVINRGADFLCKSQLANGNFTSITFSESDFEGEYESIFSAALILSCVNDISGNNKLDIVKKRIASFLVSQKSDRWTFNYWDRKSKDFKQTPYPDDLDDTFCALSALKGCDEGVVDGGVLADAVVVLMSNEYCEGGPYYTWISDDRNKWKDIDLAVNSNIAHFLSMESVKLDNINRLVQEAVKNSCYSSQYYSSEYSVIYFISRFYDEENKWEIVDLLLSRMDKKGTWGTVTDTALACLALINFGCGISRIENSILWIQSLQDRNGSWKEDVFVVEKIIKGKKYYSGSRELTTSFCLSLFQRFLDFHISNSKNSNFLDEDTSKIKEKLDVKLKKDLQEIGVCSLDEFLKVKNALIGDGLDDKIVLLPYFFRKALGKKGVAIGDDVVVDLGLAGLYGWIAYSIYDDFLDDEGDREKLILANVLLKELSVMFMRINSGNEEFADFFRKIMNDMEKANAWELRNCHLEIKNKKIEFDSSLSLGNLSVLSNKSIGHSLGVVSILFLLGCNEESDEVRNVMKFFHHYIV